MKRNKKLYYDKVFTMRMPNALHMMLEAVAEDEKITVPEIMRNLAKEYIVSKLGA